MKKIMFSNLSKSFFEKVGLPKILVKNLLTAGIYHPRPIQEKVIPIMLNGKDVLGIAQTGSGKTFAFILPVIAKTMLLKKRKPKTTKALILVPTRELASQITENITLIIKNTSCIITSVFGGMSKFSQTKKMSPGIDVLIATPGRLLEHVREKTINLSETFFWVLDEADRMLDMGFIEDVKKISNLISPKRQVALFSATMPKKIFYLSQNLLHEQVFINLASQEKISENIVHNIYNVSSFDKKKVLANFLKNPDFRSVIVFTKTKYGADALTRFLKNCGFSVSAIHGNKSQNDRQRTLKGFREGNIKTLIATDLASRGLDIIGVSHVINYELPEESENYIHRIGRTGRNGNYGEAITLYDANFENKRLRYLEKCIDKKFHVKEIVNYSIKK